MAVFKNLKIGTRLGAAFGAILVLLVFNAIVAIREMATVGQDFQTFRTSLIVGQLALESTAMGARGEATIEASLLKMFEGRDGSSRTVTALLDSNHELAKKNAENLEQIRSLATTSDERATIASLQQIRDRYVVVAQHLEGLIKSNRRVDADTYYNRTVRPAAHAYSAGYEAVLANVLKQVDVLREQMVAAGNATIQTLIVSTIVALVLGIALSLLITRSIALRLRKAVDTAEAVANGDLTIDIQTDTNDEIGQAIGAQARMVENLKTLVTQIRQSTDQVTTAVGELANGNSDLSQRTEEQASSLEETAASMEELTSTVKQNAENARQANTLALGASDIASKGGAVVGQVVNTMASINESSKKIVDIIAVIDSIAFQTNILALNAAVEAARAGEQGRGFAVVAGEVRTLAQRSATAAREIKSLIADAVSKTENGSKLVDDAGRTMGEIVDAVKRVTDIMSEITSASVEQGTGIEQVNQAIVQMDQVTQQNAALVEEASAATAALEDMARDLVASVSRFKIDDKRAKSKPSMTTGFTTPARIPASAVS